MRHGRAKAARRTLQFFERTQGIRPPYHVLLDGTFVVALTKYKFPLAERLDRLLQHGPFHLVIAQSSLEELNRLIEKTNDDDKKELLKSSAAWAKQNCETILSVREAAATDHEPHAVLDRLSDAGKDIWRWTTLQTTKSTELKLPKYICASQDEELLDVLRSTGGVPIIRLARGSILLLEHPSKAATSQAAFNERRKWKLGNSSSIEQERALVQEAWEEQRRKDRTQTLERADQRRKRKAKEPNPLSCKKKKPQTTATEQKRKRRCKRTS